MVLHYLASYSMDTRSSLPWRKWAKCEADYLTHLIWILRISGAIRLLPRVFMACKDKFTFTLVGAVLFRTAYMLV
jgi:hypothetical protein